jgi:hypothetical protein
MPRSSSRRFVFIVLLLIVAAVVVAYRFRQGAERSATSPAATAAAAQRPPPPIAATANSTGSRATADAAQAAAGAEDFAAELNQARGFRDPMLHTREFGRILRSWIERDVNSATEYVRQLPAGSDRSQAVVLLLQVIGQRDPDRALALAAELVTNREESAIYSVLFAQLAQADPASAAQKLSIVPTGSSRENAVRALADNWARRDVTTARTWAEKLAGIDRDFAVETVALSIVEQDPLHGIELAQKNLSGPALDRVLSAGLPKLAETDLSAAAAIVALLPVGETQVLAAADVAHRLATRDPNEALTWVRSLPEGRAQQVALNNTLSAWSATNPQAAEQYVDQLPTGQVQTAAAAQLARTIAARAPTDAVVWAQSVPTGATRDAVVSAVASTWAQQDPAAATQWASTLPSSPAQLEALNGALSYWLLHDAKAAQDFIGSLGADTQVSAAAAAAPQLAQSDPAGALTWAQTLPSEAARNAATIAAFARWRDNAPSAAETWLTSANLSSELKARLLRKP